MRLPDASMWNGILKSRGDNGVAAGDANRSPAQQSVSAIDPNPKSTTGRYLGCSRFHSHTSLGVFETGSSPVEAVSRGEESEGGRGCCGDQHQRSAVFVGCDEEIRRSDDYL